MTENPRLIAFYLPQFHPIPENDRWWGKGFTEWTNVVKARPLFRGHYQPHIPADMGFYDLRLPETRIAQAELAQEYRIDGFCYWHYWFGGSRLLEKPFNDVLLSKEPDYPFCLAWANVSWTGEWGGKPDHIFVEQIFPGFDDHRDHFYYLLQAFSDNRYIKIDGKPLFYIHYPDLIPKIRMVTDTWRELAHQVGLKGLFLIANNVNRENAKRAGFDAYSNHFPNWKYLSNKPKISNRILNFGWMKYRKIFNKPAVYDYEYLVNNFPNNLSNDSNHIPLVIPNWDNTPRVQWHGVVFNNSTPEKFRKHLSKVIDNVLLKKTADKIIFIKSWNEWAEGNHLEPDERFGLQYLQMIKDEVRSRNQSPNNHNQE